MSHPDGEPWTAKIPADVDQPDKIVYGLAARQLVVLAGTGLVAAWIYLVASPWMPLPVLAAALVPLVAGGIVLAIARRDGMSLDRFILAGLAYLRAPKHQVSAPEGVLPPPAWCRVRGRLPAPLRLPVRAVRDDGVMDLADGGTAVLVRTGTLPFALRTAAEQAALVASFGRWLNSLDAPVQILVRARAADLSALVEHVSHAASALADPALERAAREHAAFLAALNDSRELLVREVLLVLRDDLPGQTASRPRSRRARREAGAAVVLRRAEEAVRALAALGITAYVLDADACVQVLTEALSPAEAPLSGLARPDDLITARQPKEAPRR
ncbi:PrgI family protein [Thermoactinospora rubra]|uniref:PrgI family protein n=1 Tax=Thermoactinospora rubra TaxID=1088767 RepID=UPI000A104E39|nr:PrgI family protein [Thermoactinospora rubra]